MDRPVQTVAPVSAREALATLESAVESETGFAGRTRVWSEVASLWVALTPGGAAMDAGQDQRPFRVETAAATARDHPLAASGQRLTLNGPPWRVLAVQRTEPGRMTLLLDRNA